MEANVSLVGAAVFKAVLLVNPGRWVRFPHASANNLLINNMISKIIKILWFLVICGIIFLDRTNNTMVLITIVSLIIMTVLTVIRSLISRNEWRELIKEGDVEIKDKIKF